MRTQLLCLESSLGDGSLARRGHAAWSALSRATHYHAYELAPTREELLALCEDVEAVIIRAAPRASPARWPHGRAFSVRR